MATPSTLTVTYISVLPSTTTTQTLAIPDAGGSQQSYSLAVLNLVRSAGFWFTDSSGVLTFIPLGMVVKITAQ